MWTLSAALSPLFRAQGIQDVPRTAITGRPLPMGCVGAFEDIMSERGGGEGQVMLDTIPSTQKRI